MGEHCDRFIFVPYCQYAPLNRIIQSILVSSRQSFHWNRTEYGYEQHHTTKKGPHNCFAKIEKNKTTKCYVHLFLTIIQHYRFRSIRSLSVAIRNL